jgi:hypothetical protein
VRRRGPNNSSPSLSSRNSNCSSKLLPVTENLDNTINSSINAKNFNIENNRFVPRAVVPIILLSTFLPTTHPFPLLSLPLLHPTCLSLSLSLSLSSLNREKSAPRERERETVGGWDEECEDEGMPVGGISFVDGVIMRRMNSVGILLDGKIIVLRAARARG